jgi:hypothetical protein
MDWNLWGPILTVGVAICWQLHKWVQAQVALTQAVHQLSTEAHALLSGMHTELSAQKRLLATNACKARCEDVEAASERGAEKGVIRAIVAKGLTQ